MGADDTKSILTFYAGIGSRLSVSPGVTFAYDGPDTEKSATFIVPTAMAPGVGVAGPEVTETSTCREWFHSKYRPGDYTHTLTAEDRDCTPLFACWCWGCYAPNTFRTTLIEGYNVQF